MNEEIERLLREGLDRLTAGARVPASIAARARAHLRRRRAAVRVVMACGTAVVTAAAVIVVTGQDGGVRAPALPQARTAAYVIGRVRNAVANRNVVIQTTTTFGWAFPAITQWRYRRNVRTVQSGFMRFGVPWAEGQVRWVDGSAVVNGKRTYVETDYRHHDWYPTGSFLLPLRHVGCSISLALVESNSPDDWPGYIRQALSCGQLRRVGHAKVDGTETIEITGSATDPYFWTGLPHAVGRGALIVDATLYVAPPTYLPVRVIWNNWSHALDGTTLHGVIRQDIRVLPPTPHNIAMTRISLPAGFRKVSPRAFGGPVFRFFRVGRPSQAATR